MERFTIYSFPLISWICSSAYLGTLYSLHMLFHLRTNKRNLSLYKATDWTPLRIINIDSCLAYVHSYRTLKSSRCLNAREKKF
ncbi:hypothetical protein CIPAW_16G071000 [Carya illinoinensis]|uniref:Uncharacterized protein n=1 Tax=Carya illinoinensis TaxID=32201 RepID=A0A8T1N6J5_CARIL|nr:hypothetical protein CIPAW_16G071000 [Carya illinoinensis]